MKKKKPQGKIKNKILVNSLKLGKHPKFTNKKLTQFIYGTRNNVDLFNVTEIQNIFWRIYPFINSLFKNYQINSLRAIDDTRTKNVKALYRLHQKNFFEKLKKFTQTENNKNVKNNKNEKPIFPKKPSDYNTFFMKIVPIQILFVTGIPLYNNIIQNAAKIAQMPYYTGRWVPGSISARISVISDIKNWRPLVNNQINSFTHYFKNKHNKSSKYRFQLQTNWSEQKQPALVILPDISKNYLVVRESKNLSIPILGLTNTDDIDIIDYPILGNNESIFLVNFFCHFLATLIAKQTSNVRHNWFNSNLIYPETKTRFNTYQRTQKQEFNKQSRLVKKTKKLKSKFQIANISKKKTCYLGKKPNSTPASGLKKIEYNTYVAKVLSKREQKIWHNLNKSTVRKKTKLFEMLTSNRNPNWYMPKPGQPGGVKPEKAIIKFNIKNKISLQKRLGLKVINKYIKTNTNKKKKENLLSYQNKHQNTPRNNYQKKYEIRAGEKKVRLSGWYYNRHENFLKKYFLELNTYKNMRQNAIQRLIKLFAELNSTQKKNLCIKYFFVYLLLRQILNPTLKTHFLPFNNFSLFSTYKVNHDFFSSLKRNFRYQVFQNNLKPIITKKKNYLAFFPKLIPYYRMRLKTLLDKVHISKSLIFFELFSTGKYTAQSLYSWEKLRKKQQRYWEWKLEQKEKRKKNKYQKKIKKKKEKIKIK